jgi:mannan endo-1,4-beta-mannosidase
MSNHGDFLIPVILTILIGACPAIGQDNCRSSDYDSQIVYEPVNPDATPAAKKLLAYLYSIRGRKTILGLQISVEAEDKYIYSDYMKALTRKSPELLGYDFIGYYKPGNASLFIQEVYKKYLEGYIITLIWQERRPFDNSSLNSTNPLVRRDSIEGSFQEKTSVQEKLLDEQWKELTTPGTKLYDRWLSDIDTIATYLKALQDLGVPVLWLPYHGMNGVQFRRGTGKDGSAKLYEMMYDRYVNYFHLNNLIWVWGPAAAPDVPDDPANEFENYFPGLDYVDVLGANVYHNDYGKSRYTRLLELAKGKVIALTEVIEAPTPEVLDEQPSWTYFMVPGNSVHTHNSPAQIKDLLDDPRIISHQDFLDEK